jgi:crotonobetainyl-CoA:carnitine CoA-transferase CaiB-like acyl-CoA transferase
LLDLTLPDGTPCKAPALPLEQNGQRLGLRMNAPEIGEHTHALLNEIGYDEEAIAQLCDEQVIAALDE